MPRVVGSLVHTPVPSAPAFRDLAPTATMQCGDAASSPGPATSDGRDLSTVESPPAWFQRCIEHPVASESVTVDGCSICYLLWRAVVRRTHTAAGTRPQGIVLVHGAGAHAHWWAHIAPLLCADGFDVLAPSLSGHGSSGERAKYDEACWSSELIGTMEHAGFFAADRDGPPIVVGHSLGSYAVIRLAQRIPARLGGIVLADSGVPHPYFWMKDEAKAELRAGMTQRVATARVHPLSRPCQVTLAPAQTVRHQYIVDYIRCCCHCCCAALPLLHTLMMLRLRRLRRRCGGCGGCGCTSAAAAATAAAAAAAVALV